jgi:hypothetical protein
VTGFGRFHVVRICRKTGYERDFAFLFGMRAQYYLTRARNRSQQAYAVILN